MIKDFTYNALDELTWKAYAEKLPEKCDIDEIGLIDPRWLINGQGIEFADKGVWNVNVRVDGDDTLFSLLMKGGKDVSWVDPSTILTPIRVWAGGMDYYEPPIQDVYDIKTDTIKKKGK